MTGWRFAYAMFIWSVNYHRTISKYKQRFILGISPPYSRFAWLKNARQFGCKKGLK